MMIYANDDFGFFDDMMNALGFHRVNEKETDKKKEENVKPAEKKVKLLGDYTLREVMNDCPMANGKVTQEEAKENTELVDKLCGACKWNFMCCRLPEEWNEDGKMDSDGKKHMTQDEKDEIKKKIAELTKRLEEET